MLTLCAPVTDQVSVVVPSLVIFDGDAEKLTIVGAAGLTGGGGDDVPVGSPPPPQPSTETAMTVFKSVLRIDTASIDGVAVTSNGVASTAGWTFRTTRAPDIFATMSDSRRPVDELVPQLYDELRRLARAHLRRERPGHTLGTTALVHEAYVRLAGQAGLPTDDRTRFFAIASNTMRRVLVDYARERRRLKRGGGDVAAVPLDEVEPFLSEEEVEELIALDDALDRLAALNPRAASVVQHRFFGGFTLDETASLLDVSLKTVQRDWLAASAWLRKEVAVDLGLPHPSA